MKRHKIGTIVGWDDTGWYDSWESIDSAWESLKEWAVDRELDKKTFVSRLKTSGYLGEEFEPLTIFVYGIDKEATKGYDDAWDEAEAYRAEQEQEENNDPLDRFYALYK
jgi:hypothetical protein